MDEIKSTSQDYFYVEQAEQFVFYRIPKILFSENRYKEMSTDAKLLYGLFLDRVALSIKNKWVDDLQRVYIIYTVQKIQEILGCADKKTTKLLKELEIYGLIERKRVGCTGQDFL